MDFYRSVLQGPSIKNLYNKNSTLKTLVGCVLVMRTGIKRITSEIFLSASLTGIEWLEQRRLELRGVNTPYRPPPSTPWSGLEHLSAIRRLRDGR